MKALAIIIALGLLTPAIAAPAKAKAKPAVSKPTKPKTAPKSPEEAALAALTSDDMLRLQVFLDRAQFAPGKVDGQRGEFTGKAAKRWVAAAPGRSITSLIKAARDMAAAPTTVFTLTAEAAKFIGTVPATLSDKAAATRLPYTCFAEYLAERFHTDEATLAGMNPRVNITKIEPGDTLRVPNVQPFKIEGPRLDNPATSRLTGASLRILHNEHMLEVRNATGSLVAAFPITVGNKPEHVRTGAWKVMSMAPNPTFTWDDAMLKSGIAGTTQYLLPPGPNNPVGVLWMELEPVKGPEAHIGIHGTNDPTHIGRNHSSGCIRLANWDIVRLARLIGPGTRVAWRSSPAPGQLLAKVP